MLVTSSSTLRSEIFTQSQSAFHNKELSFSDDDVIGEGVDTLVYEDNPTKLYKALKEDTPEGREKLYNECAAFIK
ncbi:hypothetical protein [Vagococcus sp. WN89Y]|uniref:hypothetical protein n=1 Tax=Vagococcus sp. WN89Y TaxID=3457258 RepID=UPI003FCDE90E